MSETIITVQGTASEWVDAERGTVSVQVAHDGPDRASVFQATTVAAAQLTDRLAELEGAAVTRWSSDRVSVSSSRPWNEQGAQLPLVYRAVMSATARFRDFDALAAFVERFAAASGIQVPSISWDLTEERRLAVTSDVLTRAVEDATTKATTYARAAGLSTVVPIAIADPGMLGDGSDAQPGPGTGMPRGMAKSMMVMDSAGPELTLTPDRIEVAARVDARFRAR